MVMALLGSGCRGLVVSSAARELCRAFAQSAELAGSAAVYRLIQVVFGTLIRDYLDVVALFRSIDFIVGVLVVGL